MDATRKQRARSDRSQRRNLNGRMQTPLAAPDNRLARHDEMRLQLVERQISANFQTRGSSRVNVLPAQTRSSVTASVDGQNRHTTVIRREKRPERRLTMEILSVGECAPELVVLERAFHSTHFVITEPDLRRNPSPFPDASRNVARDYSRFLRLQQELR